jgi:hypothetical protein
MPRWCERPKPSLLQSEIIVSSNLTWGTNNRHGLEWFLARRDMALLEGSIPYLPTNNADAHLESRVVRLV